MLFGMQWIDWILEKVSTVIAAARIFHDEQLAGLVWQNKAVDDVMQEGRVQMIALW